MSAADILERLQRDGLRVRTDGERVILAPRERVTADVLELVRRHKPDLLRELQGHSIGASSAPSADPHDLGPHFAAALQCGRLVACVACRHFVQRPSERPDGWCRQFTTETWGKVPFQCGGYVERRQ